jgi:hypothetical protein
VATKWHAALLYNQSNLSVMQDTTKKKLVQVYAGTMWQAEVVKGLLDSNGIHCVLLDETIGAVTSSYSWTAGDAVVAVDESDEARANEVIRENSPKE